MKFQRVQKEIRREFEKKYGLKFRVNRYDWLAVYCTDLLEINEKTGEYEKCDGLCVFTQRKVYVDICGEDPLDTLIHELAHAEIHELGLELSEREEEKLVRAFAGLIAVNFNISYKRRKTKSPVK